MKISNKNEHCLGFTLYFKTHVELLFVCFFLVLITTEKWAVLLDFVCLFFVGIVTKRVSILCDSSTSTRWYWEGKLPKMKKMNKYCLPPFLCDILVLCLTDVKKKWENLIWEFHFSFSVLSLVGWIMNWKHMLWKKRKTKRTN